MLIIDHNCFSKVITPINSNILEFWNDISIAQSRPNVCLLFACDNWNCAVPLALFILIWSLRITLLEQDESKFEWIRQKYSRLLKSFTNTTPHLNVVDLNLLENKFNLLP